MIKAIVGNDDLKLSSLQAIEYVENTPVHCCFSYQHIRNFHNNNRTLKIKKTLSLSTCRGLADNHGEDHHNITVIAVSGNYSVIKDAHLAVNISTFVTFKV